RWRSLRREVLGIVIFLVPLSPLSPTLHYNHCYESAFIYLVVENSRLVYGVVPAGISDVSIHRRLDVSGENFAPIPFYYFICGRK
ncbi:MAG: hypothetical protein ACYTXY_27020, partial [Nostoc sp.]